MHTLPSTGLSECNFTSTVVTARDHAEIISPVHSGVYRVRAVCQQAAALPRANLSVVVSDKPSTVIVNFPNSRGGYWSNVTSGPTLFAAVRTAWDFFQSSYWRGERPNLETVFEVSLVGDDRKWRVKAGRVVEL
jgi:hypothetical protein